MDFFNAVRKRRSIYALENKATLEQKEILDFIDFALLNAPSAFNCQSARLIAAFGESHAKVWSIVKKSLKSIIPPEKFPPTEEKIKGFAKAYATILFFEDVKITEEMQKKFPAYKDNFTVWAQQGNAILQYMIWTGLANLGMGANLQHYNPLIDAEIAKTFNIPPYWKLIAQMPFGVAVGEAGVKEMIPPAQRMKVFK
ncbi:MAG: nitroreductase family protein [Elusimicrobia bacterium]|nr:nitroreductase family protein [Elusimicrobiota bacterium]